MPGNIGPLSSFQGFNIIGSPTGTFTYLIFVLFSLALVLIVSFWGVFDNKDRQIQKFSKFLIYLVALNLFLLVLHLPAWFGWLPGHSYIPPVERAIDAGTVLLFVWYLLFPENNKIFQTLLIVLVSLLGVLLLASFPLYWLLPGTMPFNNIYLDLIWSGIMILFSLAGLAWTLLKRNEKWILKAVIFVLFFFAGVAQILGFSRGYDVPSAFRWISCVVFPLLFIFLSELRKNSITEHQSIPNPPPLPSNHVEIMPDDLALAWAKLSSNRDEVKVPSLLSHAFANAIKSDLSFFCSSAANDFDINFSGGFNLIDKTEISSLTISKEKLPILSNALKHQELIEFSKDNAFSTDLQALNKNLHLADIGHVLFLPLINIEGQSFGLALMAPFSKKQWTRHEIDFATALANEVLPIILEYARPSRSLAAGNETPVSSALIKELEKENHKLKAELQLVEKKVLSASALLPEIKGPNIVPAAARSSDRETSPEVSGHLEMELRLTLEEIARLQNSLADANIRIHNLQNQIERPANSNDEIQEVIDSVVQELRQPMTSIVGYVDLFINESAGSLNSMQKKFIDRVQASTERMQILMDDLILTTNLQNNTFEINPDIVNVNEIIDQALQAVNGLLREKNLSLRIDVPKKLAPITADKNGLKQILVRLLFNACVATPNEQPITFKVKLEGNPSDPNQSKFLRIQVTDSGGGIPPEELSNVFDRQYRADKPLLKGIGDTGIGLTIAKNLVEAHGGNIWIESDPGKTSTINAMLPTKPPAPLPE